MKEELRKILEPQKKLFREMIQEINGKVMDYESCRLLEEFFDNYTEQMIDNFIKSIEALKKQNH